MKDLTKVEQALFNILVSHGSILTWKQIEALAPEFENRTLRKAKETLKRKGVPIGSKSGKKEFFSGASSEGGIFLIRTEGQRREAEQQYTKQATRLIIEAKLNNDNFYRFWHENLFGELSGKEAR